MLQHLMPTRCRIHSRGSLSSLQSLRIPGSLVILSKAEGEAKDLIPSPSRPERRFFGEFTLRCFTSLSMTNEGLKNEDWGADWGQGRKVGRLTRWSPAGRLSHL